MISPPDCAFPQRDMGMPVPGRKSATTRHSGMVRRTRPQMCNCTSGNLEIPGSRFARPGMTLKDSRRCGAQQPFGGGAGFGGDLGAGEHAGDFLAAVIGGERVDAGGDTLALVERVL